MIVAEGGDPAYRGSSAAEAKMVHGVGCLTEPYITFKYKALEKVLKRRTTIDDDSNVFFRLYDLIMPPPTPDSLASVVLNNGHQHLRLDCLCDG